MAQSPIVIAAGGTGGHFFPAEALGEALKRRGHHLILMTDARNTRAADGVFKDCPRYTLNSGGVAGKKITAKLKGIFQLLRGCLGARFILSQHRPSVVIGFGGYPSIPPLLGSRLLIKQRPALIIHEGNAILGQANNLLARFSTVIATSYPKVARLPESKKRALTGMPVRPPIEALADQPYHAPSAKGDDPIHLLVWGGSLGAQVFSTIVPQALCNLPAPIRKRLRLTQQVHEDLIPTLQGIYLHAGIEATLQPFIRDVATPLKEAHLVIGRAGGSSVAELAMVGRPAIYVPLPIAASDEQGANARAMEEVGGGWMIRQPDFQPETLTERLTDLFSQPDQLAQAALKARTLQHRHAAEKLADLVETTLKA